MYRQFIILLTHPIPIQRLAATATSDNVGNVGMISAAYTLSQTTYMYMYTWIFLACTEYWH